MSEDERRLPLFPLNTVLFPGMPLPLHIFEERYKLMIGTALVTDRSFGVVLIREGRQVGEPAEPFEVGTLARIAHVERLPNGEMDLIAVGLSRFRLVRIVERTPFMVGLVRSVPALDEQVEPELAAAVAERFRAFMRDARGSEEADRPLELADEPEALSFQVAAALGIVPGQRQALLELDSTEERLRRLRGLIRREHETVRLFATATTATNAGRFSLN